MMISLSFCLIIWFAININIYMYDAALRTKIMKVAHIDCTHPCGWQGYMHKLHVNKWIYRGSAVFFQLNAKTFDANYPQCNFSTVSFLFPCKIYFKLKISAFTQVLHFTVFLRLQFLNWLIYSKFYNLTVSKRDLLTTNFTFLSLLPLCDLVLTGWLWSLTLR